MIDATYVARVKDAAALSLLGLPSHRSTSYIGHLLLSLYVTCQWPESALGYNISSYLLTYLLNRPSLPSQLKTANSSFPSYMLLSCGPIGRQTFVTLHSTSLLQQHYTHLFMIFQHLFFFNTKKLISAMFNARRLDKDLIRLVNHLCTEAILLIWPTAVGDHTREQYSTIGRT